MSSHARLSISTAPRIRQTLLILVAPLLLSAAPAEAGFFDALDTLMKNYATGVVDQGDKAVATVTAVIHDPPEGQTRMEALDAALRAYGGTYHEDGTLGGNALADIKNLAKALIDAIKAIPAKLKELWKKLIGTIIGSSAEFESRVEQTWEEPEEPAEPAPPPAPEPEEPPPPPAPGGDEAGGDVGAEEPPPAPDAGGGDDAAAEEPAPEAGGGDEAAEIADEVTEDEAAPEARGSATHRASGTQAADLFSAYTSYLSAALEMRDLIAGDLDSETQQEVIPAFEEVMRQAASMQEHLAEVIARGALTGTTSLDDLHAEIAAMPIETARYAYAGVVNQIRDLLALHHSEEAQALIQHLDEIEATMTP